MWKTNQSSRKRHKLSDGKQIDRFGGLPDAIICHILSFLPTKISVKTSALARRWRFLWAHVPNIHFESSGYRNTKLNDGKSFSDIIYRVMLFYKVQNMNSFRLSYTQHCGEYQLETCISTAIVRNVKNIYLHLQNQDRLPRCIFTYKTLVELRLQFCDDIIPMSGAVCLPALKKLYLFMVKYESDKSLAHLLSGCPVLEELTVLRIKVDPLVCCCISSSTLNRLELHSDFDNDGSYTDTYTVKIDTPALRYLRLWDSISKYISFGSLTSLIEADVHIPNYAQVEGDVLYRGSVLEFVGRLYKVKSLTLSTGLMEVPDSAFSALTVKFHNLTELELDADWHFISKFLENADNLEVLIIRMVNEDLKCWMDPHLVPTCLLSHLRMVKIDQLGCTEQEFNMVRYLLRNAKILKTMEIHSKSHGIDLKGTLDALKRISKFQRGSEVDIDPTYWMEPEQVPTCLLSHLKIVRIDLVECIEQEFNMVRYLLRNAEVLERMEIYFMSGTGKKAKFDAVKIISLFQRGSEACQLVFH